jgi:hypothetical protein
MPLRLSYVAMLVFTILGSFWLELALKIVGLLGPQIVGVVFT